MSDWGGLNLGNLSSALSLSGANPELLEQLRQEQALRDAAAQGAEGATAPPREFGRETALALADYERRQREDPLGVASGKARTLLRDGTPSNGELSEAPAPRFDLPAGTQQALARTGSSYRVPATQQQPAPSPLPEGTDRALELLGQRPAQPPTVNPNASTPDLKTRQTQLVNDEMADQLALGDSKAEAHDRKAAMLGEDAVSGQMRLDETTQRRDEALTRKDANTKEAYNALHAMQSELGSPPDTSKGRVLQIIGTVLSMTPRGGGIGKGLSMLGSMMGDDVQRWAAGVEGSDKLRKAFLEMNRHEDAGVESELQQTAQISSLVAANTLNSLKQAEEEAGSDEAKAVARHLARGVEDSWLSHQVELRKQQGDLARKNALFQMPMEELAQRIAGGEIGEEGQKVFRERTKASQDTRVGEAEIELKQAQADKERAEIGAGPKLSDSEKKLQRHAESVRPAYDSLSNLADRVAKDKANVPYIGIGPDGSQMFADEKTQNINGDILSLADVLLRDSSGAVLGDSEQENKWRSWGITSPDQAVRNRGLGKMLAEYEGRIAHVQQPGGPAPAAPSGQQQGGGAGAGGDMVMMRTPLGRLVPIPRDKADAHQKMGYKVQGLDLANVVGRSR